MAIAESTSIENDLFKINGSIEILEQDFDIDSALGVALTADFSSTSAILATFGKMASFIPVVGGFLVGWLGMLGSMNAEVEGPTFEESVFDAFGVISTQITEGFEFTLKAIDSLRVAVIDHMKLVVLQDEILAIANMDMINVYFDSFEIKFRGLYSQYDLLLTEIRDKSFLDANAVFQESILEFSQDIQLQKDQLFEAFQPILKIKAQSFISDLTEYNEYKNFNDFMEFEIDMEKLTDLVLEKIGWL